MEPEGELTSLRQGREEDSRPNAGVNVSGIGKYCST